MQKQPNVSASAYNVAGAQDLDELYHEMLKWAIIAPEAPSLPGGVSLGGSPPLVSLESRDSSLESRARARDPSLDPLLNKCVNTDNVSNLPKRRYKACPTPSGYFHGPKGETQPAPCNKWTCPFCGPKKKHRVLERVAHGQETGGLRWRSLTLTQQIDDPMDIMIAWASMRRTLANHGKRHYKFFLTKEHTKAGKLHLHLVISAYISHSLLRECWREATRGSSYIVDIRSCNDVGSLAGYMSKYMTKTLGTDAGFAKHERRYSFSQWLGWTLPYIPPEPGWSYTYAPHGLFVYVDYDIMDWIDGMRARGIPHWDMDIYVAGERAMADSIQSATTDVLSRHGGISIDVLPWDDMGRLILS